MKRALELILKEDAQQVFDAFSACFDIRILFYSPKGEVLATGQTRDADSNYCALLQDRVFGEGQCLALDDDKRKEAAEKRGIVCYRCHAGLREAVMPIYAGKQLLGFVMIGQLRCEADVPHEMAKIWARKYAPGVLEAAYAELPLVPVEKVDHVLKLFSIMVTYMVSRHMITLKGDLLLEEVITYIEDHVAEPVSLAGAAATVYRSESTISHLFKKKLGKTFKGTVIETKLDTAETYMRTVPGLTVAEVAGMVGYQDPFHFSAIYKKYRGHPPSVYLKQHRPG